MYSGFRVSLSPHYTFRWVLSNNLPIGLAGQPTSRTQLCSCILKLSAIHIFQQLIRIGLTLRTQGQNSTIISRAVKGKLCKLTASTSSFTRRTRWKYKACPQAKQEGSEGFGRQYVIEGSLERYFYLHFLHDILWTSPSPGIHQKEVERPVWWLL